MNNEIITLSEATRRWKKQAHRWPNFAAVEMACTCCGEVYWSPEEFDRAQNLRTALARPVSFNSTHRCYRNNARVGGAPKSQHKRIAFDFSLCRPAVSEAELATLQEKMLAAGFGTFGLYRTFIHTDSRRGRFWIVSGGERWKAHFHRQ